MTLDTREAAQSESTVLCKACGLCCTGHLFAWTKLRSAELRNAEIVGLQVLGTDPRQRGFGQPCSLWHGTCTIYESAHYPHFCRLYKCALLKKVIDESVTLRDALNVVQQTKGMIAELESLLPSSSNRNFRERLVQELEYGEPEIEFQHKARRLLSVYKNQFGVTDLVENFDVHRDDG